MATAVARKGKKPPQPKAESPSDPWPEVPQQVIDAILSLDNFAILTPLRIAYTKHQRKMNERQIAFCERAVRENHPLLEKEVDKARQILEMFPDALDIKPTAAEPDLVLQCTGCRHIGSRGEFYAREQNPKCVKCGKRDTFRVLSADEQIAAHNAAAAAEIAGELDLRDDEPGTLAAAEAVFDVELTCLRRHPDNREPTEEDVREKAESLQEVGQLEPILVRGIGNGEWQILSGETRYLAAKSLGLQTIKARAIACDDARALELLAAYNAHRKDLNPIQQAKLILRLCEPRDKGGAGLTQAAAAKIVGLETGAGASNLLRLLKLPQVWQDRVASGELPQSYARLLASVVHLPAVLRDLDDFFTSEDPYEREAFESRKSFQEAIHGSVKANTRRLDGEKIYYGHSHPALQKDYALQGYYPCLLPPEELQKHWAELDVVTIADVDEEGESREIEAAANVDLFDRLQIAHIKANAGKEAKSKAEASAKEPKKKTKAQTAAEIERGKEVRAKLLHNAIDQWKERLMRRELAEKIRELKITAKSKPDPRLLLLMMYFMADGLQFDRFNFAQHWSHEHRGYRGTQGPYPVLMMRVEKSAGDATTTLMQIAQDACAILVTGEGASGEYQRGHAIDRDDLASMFDAWDCDLDGAWKRLHARKDPMEEEFYTFFRKGELAELGVELSVHLADTMSKEQMIAVLINRPAPLPLPSILAGEKAKPTKKKKGAK